MPVINKMKEISSIAIKIQKKKFSLYTCRIENERNIKYCH